MNTSKCAFYGSLRVGQWNYRGWDIDKAQVVQLQDKIKGYRLRTDGCLPAIFEADPAAEVVVDVFDLDGMEDTFAGIHRMELGAGYFRRLVITEGGHEAWIYPMEPESISYFPTLIQSGDWYDYAR